MDPLQLRLAHIALEIVGGRGFVLGGGHADELHGMGTRPSEDIDLFSNVRGSLGEVAGEVVAAFERSGLTVAVLRQTPDLVQVTVTDDDGHACKVDLQRSYSRRSTASLHGGCWLALSGRSPGAITSTPCTTLC